MNLLFYHPSIIDSWRNENLSREGKRKIILSQLSKLFMGLSKLSKSHLLMSKLLKPHFSPALLAHWEIRMNIWPSIIASWIRRKMFEECLKMFWFPQHKVARRRISSIEISVRFACPESAWVTQFSYQFAIKWLALNIIHILYFNIQHSSIRYLFALALPSSTLRNFLTFKLDEENGNLLICFLQTQNVEINLLLKILQDIQEELDETKLWTASLNAGGMEKQFLAWH